MLNPSVDDATMSVVRGAFLMEEFFGSHLSKVNRTLQLIYLYDPPPPEWMRGKIHFKDLPRVTQGPLPFTSAIPLIPQRLIARRVRWIVDNGTGAWSFDKAGFGFEDERDHMHYLLRFA